MSGTDNTGTTNSTGITTAAGSRFWVEGDQVKGEGYSTSRGAIKAVVGSISVRGTPARPYLDMQFYGYLDADDLRALATLLDGYADECGCATHKDIDALLACFASPRTGRRRLDEVVVTDYQKALEILNRFRRE